MYFLRKFWYSISCLRIVFGASVWIRETVWEKTENFSFRSPLSIRVISPEPSGGCIYENGIKRTSRFGRPFMNFLGYAASRNRVTWADNVLRVVGVLFISLRVQKNAPPWNDRPFHVLILGYAAVSYDRVIGIFPFDRRSLRRDTYILFLLRLFWLDVLKVSSCV